MPLPLLLDQQTAFILDKEGKDRLIFEMLTREGPIEKVWPDPLFSAGDEGELGFGNGDSAITLTTTSSQTRVIDKLTPMENYIYYHEWGIYPNGVKFQRKQDIGNIRGRLQRDQSQTKQPWLDCKDLRYYVINGHLDDRDCFYTLKIPGYTWAVEFTAYNDTGSTQTPRLKFMTWMFKVKQIKNVPQNYRRFYLPPIGSPGGLRTN